MLIHRLFADPFSAPAPRVSRYARAVCWAWVVVLLAICVHVVISPHTQSSYARDYAPAGWHWLHGTEIYSRRHHFVYGPPVAACFAPLAALPGVTGDLLWRLGSAGLLLGVGGAWFRSRTSSLGDDWPARPRRSLPLPTAFLLLLPLAIGNLNLGQMNVLVLALAAGGVLAVRRESWSLATVLLAAPAFIKIYPLAVGLLAALLWPRQLSWRLALALLGGFALSFALQRPAYVWSEYRQWFAVLGRDDRLDVDLYATWRDFGYLLRASGVPLSDHAYRIMEVASGGVLALFLWWGRRWKHWPEDKLLGGLFCLGCAWMMLFGPATEAATYVVLALPVCGLLVAAWSLPATPVSEKSTMLWRALLTTVYALLLFADTANALFHGLTHHLFMRALQPVAALIFAGGVVWRLGRRLPDAPAGPMLAHANVHGENGGGRRSLD